MKHCKKLLALLLALVMTLALSVTALAAGNGSITIENATPGKEYKIYKIFDATYNKENNAASYTIKKDSQWYDLIKNATFEDVTLFELVEPAGDDSIALVKPAASATTFRISGWFSSQEVKDKAETFEGTAKYAESATVTFTGLDYGYYYISSGLGATVTITNVSNSAKVIDKNQTPGWGEEGGKFIDNNGTLSQESSAGIGENVDFKVKINNAFNYSGADKITEYIINDLEGSAIYVDFHSIKVKINGKEIAGGWIEGLDGDNQNSHAVTPGDSTTNSENCNWYVLNRIENDSHFYIHIIWQNADGSFRYSKEDGNPNTIEVSYTAVLTGNASMGNVTTNNTNTAELSWKVANGSEHEDPTTSTVTVYSYAFGLLKIDTADRHPLANATFQLKDAEGSIIQLYRMKSNDMSEVYYVVNTYTESGKVDEADISAKYDSFTTPVSGQVVIKGLKEGNYFLVEKTAPDGYNVVKDAIPVELNKTTISGIIDKISVNLTTVENSSGTELPETGGIGTVLFVALGALAVVGAGIFLVTNKRISKENF